MKKTRGRGSHPEGGTYSRAGRGPFCLIVAMMAVSAAGCTPRYIPGPLNMPLHEESGDTELAVGVGWTGFFAGGSTALTDHLGLQISGTYFDVAGADEKLFRHWSYDVAVGYYAPVGDLLNYALYGGVGPGFSDVNNGRWIGGYTTSGNARYFRYLVQGQLAVSSGVVGMIVGARVAAVDFNHYVQDGERQDLATAVSVDPALLLWFGGPYLHPFVQVTGLIPFFNPDRTLPRGPIRFLTFGLQTRIKNLY